MHLRTAVQYANGQGGSRVIQLRAGTYKLSVLQGNSDATGDSGDLDVTATATIQGAGASLTTITSANQVTWNDRILEADYGATLTLNDVRISGGHTTLAGVEGAPGGGIFSQGGGLTLNRVLVDGNKTSTTGDSTENGGGISAMSASLVINDSTISNNTAGFNGGGVDFEFGTSVTINNSTFSGNAAGQDGGGLYNHGSQSIGGTFSRLFFTGNTSNGTVQFDAGGGAIYNELASGIARFTDIMVVGNHATRMNGGGVYENSDPKATVTYDRSTLASNDADRRGGGFYNGFSRPTVTNSTITDNSIHLDDQNGITDGGGVAVGIVSGVVTLNNDTITRNSAPAASGGGLYVGSGESIKLHNTLVVNNLGKGGTVSNCHKDGKGSARASSARVPATATSSTT
ncbi:MAG TPA: hypothetical protein VGR61_05625 [Candidatus Dormibacteraeota bacterium]|nr:hypothetical protein [Candidatus Dormibacteraeota bacterium]